MHDKTIGEMTHRPIIVDLDGTLIRTDTLHESVLELIRVHPQKIILVPFWLLKGRAFAKAKIAELISLNPANLPYNDQLIDMLRFEKERGRQLVLCSGADKSIAMPIAEHVGIFDNVIASDGKLNVTGVNKRIKLDEVYGYKGYDYIGNSSDDLAVWAGSLKGMCVNSSGNVRKRALKIGVDEIKINYNNIKSSKIYTLAKAIRVHQWVKNTLLFLPLVAAHQITNIHAISLLVLAFLSFSLCASAVYVINDLVDLDNDRQHSRKRNRPFASGILQIRTGVAIALIALCASVGISIFVGSEFAAWLIIYFLLTMAYSVSIKRYVLIDCITLAVLYSLRIVSGAAAVNIQLSFWMIAYSVFFFLSLAFLKRYAELKTQCKYDKIKIRGRGYFPSDIRLIQMIGVSSSNLSVLILALYLNSDSVNKLYSSPQIIWTAIPIMLYWLSWVWLQADRGRMHDDPILFALNDRNSWFSFLSLTIVYSLSTYVK